MGRSKIDRDDLIDELRDLDDRIDRDPRRRDMNEIGEYSAQTYVNRFGSWADALDAADIEADQSHQSPIPDSELINALQRMDATSDERPTTSEMDEDGPYSSRTYRQRFESWKGALEAAGIEADERIGTGGHLSDEQRRDALMTLTRKLGRPPSSREMERYGRYGSTTYEYQYGSWNEALRRFGLNPAYESVEERKGASEEDGDSDDHWHYWSTYRWQKAREKVLERDGYECQSCGRTESENQERFGVGLSAYHEAPDIIENDPTQEIQTEMMVALCSVCHGARVNGHSDE
jgi:hypothetical protein